MLRITQPIASTARIAPRGFCIGVIVAFGCCAALRAQEPPPDLVKRVARMESETKQARDQYTYRQTVSIEELDGHGGKRGEYREVRDIIFSPTQERTERMVGLPASTLKRLMLTEEDYRDIREIQPFVFTEELVRLYEVKFRGDERIDDLDCWVLQVRPRQILQGQRLFDGMMWIDKKNFAIVRSEGRAVPEIRTSRSENLFPYFTTLREPVGGVHRFPIRTYSDDTLQFRTGPQRIRTTIRYSDYKKFGAESSVTFEK